MRRRYEAREVAVSHAATQDAERMRERGRPPHYVEDFAPEPEPEPAPQPTQVRRKVRVVQTPLPSGSRVLSSREAREVDKMLERVEVLGGPRTPGWVSEARASLSKDRGANPL